MPDARRTGIRAFALATVAGLALAGPVWSQGKPSPQGAARPALPTTKPAPLGAPQAAPPPVAQAPRPAPQAPPPVAQAPGGKPGQAAPPVAQVPAPAPPPQILPTNEPPALTRLRRMMGAEVRLSYATVDSRDALGESVRLTGVVLERPGKRATADEVLINGLREDGVAEVVARGLTTEEAGTTVRIGLISISGLTVPRDASGAPPQPDQVRLEALRIEGLEATGATRMRLTSASITNWIAGQPASFTLEGLEVGGIDGGMIDALRLARVSLTGVDFGGTLAALMRQEAPPNLVGHAALEVDGLELTGQGRAVGGLREARAAADVTRVDGSGTGTIALRGIRVEPVPAIAGWLQRFGYQTIEAEVTADSSFDGNTGRVEIRNFSIAGNDVGTLSFALTMDGVTQERVRQGDIANMRLISAAIRYADASLFGRFVGLQARESRTPEPQLREQFAAMVGGALSQPGAAGLDPIRDAVQRFIRGQARSVEIRIAPPQPIRISDVQGAPPSPAEAQRMFGVTAEAH